MRYATVTFTDATTPGSCANNYTVTRTFVATDACGNTATASQAITVIDNTPPVLAGVGGPSTINCPATPSFHHQLQVMLWYSNGNIY
jgi:hypothetical protein